MIFEQRHRFSSLFPYRFSTESWSACISRARLLDLALWQPLRAKLLIEDNVYSRSQMAPHSSPSCPRRVSSSLCLVSYRSVVVPVKKPPPGSLSVNTVGAPVTGGAATAASTPNIFAAATATPKSMINTTGEKWADAYVYRLVICIPRLKKSRWHIAWNQRRFDTIREDTIRYEKMRREKIWYEKILYNRRRYNMIQSEKIQYNRRRYDTIGNNMIRYNTIREDMMQKDMMQKDTIQ